MNKQEAIEIVESRAFNIGDIDLACGLSYTKHIINQIDEPKKVTIPKFVAEWIEETEKIHNNLSWVWFSNPDSDKLNDWLKNHTETFMRAWLDGYTVEKEKLYTVEIPNNGGTLVLASIRYAIQLVDSNKHFPGKFTKESIEEAGFGWVFGCDGVKVVEEDK